jgi:hypothetical protein
MTREDKYTRDVKGYEGLYKVNALGKVFSVKRNKMLSETVDKHGYVKYCLTKDGTHRQVKAHRIVAEAFIPNPQNKREVNHIDGDKSNNAVWNLEWTRTSENARHSVRVGLRTQCKSVRIVETGEVFPSLGECARTIGGDVGNISRCLNTDKSDTHKGFHFERVV